jgi:hypothetical protein
MGLEGLCRSAWARVTGLAGLRIGLNSRTRKHQR